MDENVNTIAHYIGLFETRLQMLRDLHARTGPDKALYVTSAEIGFLVLCWSEDETLVRLGAAEDPTAIIAGPHTDRLMHRWNLKPEVIANKLAVSTRPMRDVLQDVIGQLENTLNYLRSAEQTQQDGGQA
jgi:hypothetical protein